MLDHIAIIIVFMKL